MTRILATTAQRGQEEKGVSRVRWKKTLRYLTAKSPARNTLILKFTSENVGLAVFA